VHLFYAKLYVMAIAVGENEFMVGNMPWLMVWHYYKHGFALHIWSVLHYKTLIPARKSEWQLNHGAVQNP